MRGEGLNSDFGVIRPESYRQDVCSFLSHVEKTYDVNALRHGEFYVWPVLRCILATAMENQVLGFRSFPSNGAANETLVKDLQGIFSDVAGKPLHEPLSKSHINVGSLEELSEDRFQDAILCYSRYSRVSRPSPSAPFHNADCDDFIEDAMRSVNCYSFEVFRGEKTENLSPRRIVPFFLEYHADRYDNGGRWKGLHIYEQFVRDLIQYENVPEGAMPSSQAVQGVLMNIVRRKHFFDEVLAVAKPRAVGLSLFYDFNEGTASLIWACRDAGIPTIEFQHGLIGKYHWAFTDWTSIPEGGYPSLPNFLMCWENAAVGAMSESNIQNAENLVPYLVGNKRLEPADPQKPKSVAAQNLIQCASAFEKTVMFTAQYGLGMIPKSVVETILAAPKSWFWLIRLHPLGRPMESTWNELLFNAGVTNYDIHLVNEIDIGEAMYISDHVVSSFSSTAYEAIDAGKPCTITTEIGLECLADEIENGNLNYSGNAKGIIETINNPRAPAARNESKDQVGYQQVFDDMLTQFQDVNGI